MVNKLKNVGFYFIASSEYSEISTIKQVELAIDAGVKVIQLREKNIDRKQMHETAAKVRELTKKAKILFIVNDYLDVAIKADADGVNLGKNDFDPEQVKKIMPDIIVGLSVRSIEEAVEAEQKGCDYVYFGPIYKSRSGKDNLLGVEAISELKKKLKIPIIAIGGISKDNAKEVLSADADGFVVASELFNKKDIGKEIKLLVSMVKS
jgi:thiamine-phosphate pyrophosphorylase